jgi:hypothetical protein
MVDIKTCLRQNTLIIIIVITNGGKINESIPAVPFDLKKNKYSITEYISDSFIGTYLIFLS